MNRIVLNGGADYLVWRDGSGGTVEIWDINVGTDRRRGIGRQLIRELLERVPREVKVVWAVARADNIIAKQFYEALRFRIAGNLWRFYSGNTTVDAVVYAFDVGTPI